MNNGGGYLGIHAASDTYRHSTANGSSTGTWDWYAEMAGASVQEGPNRLLLILTLDNDTRAVEVLAIRKGKSLKY